MTRILEKENTIASNFLAELRDEVIQKDSMRFRRNLERIGEVMAYEVSKTLDYSFRKVVTPLGESDMMLCEDNIVIATILRAAVPMANGMLNIFDKAEFAFVAAHRHYRKKGEMEICVEQVTTPSLEDKVLIIVDPMVATAASMELAYEALLEKGGIPRHTHICSVLCSEEGRLRVENSLCRGRVSFWSVACDKEMTNKSYIVPGLGDAGDLAYGSKL
ncbi:MAG: uracil phosphoribosyltransferase [Rikenellaceae bacterium]